MIAKVYIVHYSDVITRKRQFVGMLGQVSQSQLQSTHHFLRLGGETVLGSAALENFIFRRVEANPDRLVPGFYCLDAGFKQQCYIDCHVCEAARAQERRCKQTDTSPTIYVITMRQGWLLCLGSPILFLSVQCVGLDFFLLLFFNRNKFSVTIFLRLNIRNLNNKANVFF